MQPTIRAVAALLIAIGGGAPFKAPSSAAVQQPARDTSARKEAAGEATAVISGRVVAADTGRPLRRARVFVSAAELPAGRGVLTDAGGRFVFDGLPAGRYTVTAAVAGFVPLTFGQRRPLQSGAPIQLARGQQVTGLDFRLPRGSVIGGRVFDDRGDPVAGVTVRAMRYQYQQGERRLMPAAAAATNDQGAFRVWGLNPGRYYVEAQVPVRPAFLEGGSGALGDAGSGTEGNGPRRAFAATYYPSVASPAQAQPVMLGLGQQTLGVDLILQFARVAQVAGHVFRSTGAAAAGTVMLVPEIGSGGFSLSYGARIGTDGAFTIPGVPPGRYTLQARGNDSARPLFAAQPLSVGDSDIDDVSITLEESGAVSGSLVFAGRGSPPADARRVRVAVVSTEAFGGTQEGGVDNAGRFRVGGLQPGRHVIRIAGEIRGWTLKSVTLESRDVTDTPIEVTAGRELTNLVVTLTDRAAEITGTLTSEGNVPHSEYTMLAFSTDPGRWQSRSRYIVTARPDQNGAFRIRGLPAGSYYLTAVDPIEPDEWFDPAYLDEHRAGAALVTVGEGETKTQDFRVVLP